MEQLLLKMDDKSDVKVIASSAYNFRIELVKKVGKDDIPGLIEMRRELSASSNINLIVTLGLNRTGNKKGQHHSFSFFHFHFITSRGGTSPPYLASLLG